MTDVVIDASVVAKWYLPDRDSEYARAVRDGYLNGRHTLLAPALLPFEVVNALNYSGHYNEEQVRDAAQSITDYGISLVPYREGGPITDVATTLDVTIYDAAYLALGHANEAIVYTADQQLIAATEGSQYAETVSHVDQYA